jgi:hypothetical protein
MPSALFGFDGVEQSPPLAQTSYNRVDRFRRRHPVPDFEGRSELFNELAAAVESDSWLVVAGCITLCKLGQVNQSRFGWVNRPEDERVTVQVVTTGTLYQHQLSGLTADVIFVS